ncbi:MAG TPA: flavodoxin domain-containing protein [Thermotogota bacterium]|nr:flavodoxin domain-containing protein [Thermotogota bacterium]HPJ88412.1 flavodoxin domain-containing protein [Thermotogota bacterium]HPR95421.1 flavodoxin domain-containing protein [Thermotogota bacterium]
MKNLVIYASRKGNTAQIAEQIALELCCEMIDLKAMDVEQIPLDDVDNIFLGSGIYAEYMNSKIKRFLRSENLKQAALKRDRNLIFFVTWVGNPGSVENAIEKCYDYMPEEGISIYTDHFRAYGTMFGLFKKGHPSEEEKREARTWANEVLGKIENPEEELPEKE